MSNNHDHILVDSDSIFVIDTKSRSVACEAPDKTHLMQYDHNSERFTFTVDRFIEGHDMYETSRIQIHYVNSSESANKRPGAASGSKNIGIYEVSDIQLDSDNNDRLLFSWVISQHATSMVGSLSFVVVFTCVENNEVTYRWSTNANNLTSILEGINNSNEIVETYPEIFDYLEQKLDKHIIDCDSKIDENIARFEEDIYEYLNDKSPEPIEYATSEEIEAVFR